MFKLYYIYDSSNNRERRDQGNIEKTSLTLSFMNEKKEYATIVIFYYQAFCVSIDFVTVYSFAIGWITNNQNL